MTQMSRSRRLDRVAHRLDRRIPDRMRGDLQTGRRGLAHQIAQLVACCAPYAATGAHRDSLRSAVDEHLDRAGADQRAAKAGLHAELGRRLEQLPREKFVDADTEPAVACQAFISTQV